MSYDEKVLYYLFRTLFVKDDKPFKPYKYQLKIAVPIYYKTKKRIIITATTRAGKTFIVALTTILVALKYPNQHILLLAPRYEQSKILMGYITQHLFDSPVLLNQIADRKTLSAEVSKEKITFKNGSVIKILSAQGSGTGKAERLMGFGGDLIVVDESALIDDEVFRVKVMRMLGDNPQAQLVEIGNPVHLNHFYEHFNDPDYYKIQIHWQECVKEGRLTQEYVDEQRRNLTPAEFKMLYDAEFVEEMNNTLLNLSAISKAINKKGLFKKDDKTWYEAGVDVARFGNDLSVITIVKTDGYSYKVIDIKSYKQNTVPALAGEVIHLNKKYNFASIKIDDIGVGGGVTDILGTEGLPVIPFKASDNATNFKRFKNLKIETAWKLKTLFQEHRISIPNHPELIKELRKWTFDYTTDNRLHLVDPKDKSPDFADSLLYAIYQGTQPYFTTARAI